MDARTATMPQVLDQQVLAAQALFERGKYQDCVLACLQGLKTAPRHLQLLEILAIAHLQSGDAISATETYKKILKYRPGHFLATLNTAKIHINHGRFEEALPFLLQCEATGKMAEEVQYLLGLYFEAVSRYPEAIDRFSAILEANPRQALAYIKMASCLGKLKHLKEAMELIEAAQTILPESQELLFGKALILKEHGLNVASLEAFEKLAKIQPENVEFVASHAEHLSAMKKMPEALARYADALALAPQHVRSLNGLGIALTQLKRLDEAEEKFKGVLKTDPNNLAALTNLSTLMMMRRDLKQAWKYSERLFNLDQNFAGQYLYQMCFHCDWQHYGEALVSLKSDSEFKRSNAFTPIIYTDNPAIHLGYAKKHAETFKSKNEILGPMIPHKREGKIKLGYYTCDFFAHATAMLIEGLLQCHNREQFELHAFSLDLRPQDAYNQRLRKLFDHYHDVHHISDLAVTHMSRELKIDIAIDLKGYTEGSRTSIFAERAAPVQINFLGFPGSMGADYIDYIVADHHLITPETRPFYAERVIYMPNSYQPNYPGRPKPRFDSPRPTELPVDKFVFCSFNNSYKITPDVFRLWMEILHQTDNSVLWLLSPPPEGKDNLLTEASAQGIAPERIIFAPYLPEAEHLARLTHADLFLDTFPCNAHTTASDALWANVPIVTRTGQAFASRVAGSLLKACDLSELVAHDAEAYKSKAIELFNNKDKLKSLRMRISEKLKAGPLYDIEKYTKYYENGLLKTLITPENDIIAHN